MVEHKAPLGPSLREKMNHLLAEHSMGEILKELQRRDIGEFEDELDTLGYSKDPEPEQLSAEELASVEEAEAMLRAMRDAENMMIAGRRDDARHKLYMALPSGPRDLFYPTQGFKA